MVLQMYAVSQMHMVAKVVADGAILFFPRVAANVTTGLIFDGNSMNGLGHDQKLTKSSTRNEDMNECFRPPILHSLCRRKKIPSHNVHMLWAI